MHSNFLIKEILIYFFFFIIFTEKDGIITTVKLVLLQRTIKTEFK